jgi:hypothetical protein
MVMAIRSPFAKRFRAIFERFAMSPLSLLIL